MYYQHKMFGFYLHSLVPCPLPVKVYQTPNEPTQLPGAVSETVFTVVPARFEVPQGSAIALAQASFAGGVGAGHDEH
jgi:hypothetical protein